MTRLFPLAPSTRLSFLFVLAVLFVSAFLTGCADGVFTTEDQVSQARRQTGEAYTGPKLRHAHLLDRAIRRTAGKSASHDELSLIVAVHSGVDKQKVVERFKNVERYKSTERYEYNYVFDGFALSVEDTTGSDDYQEFLDSLALDPEIMWIEPSFEVNTPSSNTAPGGLGQQIPWSVAAIGGQTSWAVSGDGQGDVNVDVYILDTGIANAANNDPNVDLDLVESIDFRDGFDDASDYDGHGTHIAGIIGAVDDNDGLVGIAPGARIHNYKVLGDNGISDVSVVIAAIEHITTQKLANPSTPMIVNLSLGEDIDTPDYSALDEAVDASVAAGVVYVIAAGNQDRDVANMTPAKVEGAITVGSYAITGAFSPFSNWGPKVDLLAPGEDIVSLSPSSDPVEMTGTSMSTAHVTGAAALYLAQNPTASPSQVEDALVAAAQESVTGTNGSTTNKSVWIGMVQTISGTVRDEFRRTSYSENDGSLAWDGDWIEIGESDGAKKGYISIEDDRECPSHKCLRIEEKDEMGISRSVDLSEAHSVMLSIDWRRQELKEDRLHLEVSSDGGASWTSLKTFDSGSDNKTQSGSFDLSDHTGGFIQIRLYRYDTGKDKNKDKNKDKDKGGNNGEGYLYVDDVEVEIDN